MMITSSIFLSYVLFFVTALIAMAQSEIAGPIYVYQGSESKKKSSSLFEISNGKFSY